MGKYAIITGVSSGIGKCIANEFIKSKIHVFGIDENAPENQKIDFFECDIRNEEKIIEVFEEIRNRTKCIDYLINCAGIFCYRERTTIDKLTKEEWQNVIDINLTGTFLVSKYSIPLLRASNNGNIINLSSEQVVLPQKKSAPYAITKAGIEMFSKILAFELMDDKIRVNTIALASVRTNFLKRYKKDEKIINDMMIKTDKSMPYGIIEPEDVSNLVKYLIKKNNKITGQTILIDSGIVLNVNKK